MATELTGKYAGTKPRLMQELKSLQKEKFCDIQLRDGNIMKWKIGLMVVNPESYYDGGYFLAEMSFSEDYPHAPPSFKFIRPIYHPNIYPDGKICISILHPPGEDLMSGESASERWSPLQGVESVLRSILLLFDDPECSSPANVDAGVMFRRDRAQYIQKAFDDVEASKKDIPEGFIMPVTLMEAPPVKEEVEEGFWDQSDAEEDFGGSDSSGEDNPDFDEDEDDDSDT